MKKQIAIAGCGVIGLTTGLRLLEAGYAVQIFTRDLPLQTTSVKAAAFWFPYHVRDNDQILHWSMLSYKRFENIAGIAGSGVHMTAVFKLGSAVNEIEKRIRDTLPANRFRPLMKEELRGNFESGWYVEVPLIETPVYLPWLMNVYLAAGGKMVQHTIQALDELAAPDTIVINCTGLASRELAHDDQVIPVRGQIALLKTSNRRRIVMEDDTPTYVVYRSDACICGSTYEMHCNAETTEPETLQAIINRCIALEPALQAAEMIDSWAGLRPYRADIRVEIEQGKPLIHNYGHGGSGFTVSWGCAEEVLNLLGTMA